LTVVPAITEGKRLVSSSKKIVMANGNEQTFLDIRRTLLYRLLKGDEVIDYMQGRGGVSSPPEGDAEMVRENVITRVVSIESARNDNGVVIDPHTFIVDTEQTKRLRKI
jgi:N-methylhydantoinase B